MAALRKSHTAKVKFDSIWKNETYIFSSFQDHLLIVVVIRFVGSWLMWTHQSVIDEMVPINCAFYLFIWEDDTLDSLFFFIFIKISALGERHKAIVMESISHPYYVEMLLNHIFFSFVRLHLRKKKYLNIYATI